MEQLVVKLMILTLGVLTSCSYGAHFSDCAVRCTSDSVCPDGLTCQSQVCRPPGTTEACPSGVAPDGGGDTSDAVTQSCQTPTGPVDLALSKPTSADQMAQPASNANDGDDSTRWSSNEGTPGHWWRVDLGADYPIASLTTLWEYEGVNYRYAVSISFDDTNFAVAIDETADTRTTRLRTDAYPSMTCARFVKITKTDTTGYWAILYTVNVMGQ